MVAKAAIAKKALPKCNIVYRNGQEMKKDISAYLQVLYDASPAAVGGMDFVFRFPIGSKSADRPGTHGRCRQYQWRSGNRRGKRRGIPEPFLRG